MTVDAYLPYADTSGWSGSDTSMERAIDADKSGETKHRQQQVINFLRDSGADGLTWVELQQLLPLHHGALSGTLSVLHRVGAASRLSQKRGRCKVYVLPEFVGDRDTEQQGRKKNCPHCGGEL